MFLRGLLFKHLIVSVKWSLLSEIWSSGDFCQTAKEVLSFRADIKRKREKIVMCNVGLSSVQQFLKVDETTLNFDANKLPIFLIL